MKQQPEKSGRTEWASKRQNMFGKCSTTCLQFIINFLKPSQSYRSGARASGAIPFHWHMWLCFVLLCLFTCFLSTSHTWDSLKKHMLPEGQQAHTLSVGETQQSSHIRHLSEWKVQPFWTGKLTCFLSENNICPFQFCLSHLKAALKHRMSLCNLFPQ